LAVAVVVGAAVEEGVVSVGSEVVAGLEEEGVDRVGKGTTKRPESRIR